MSDIGVCEISGLAATCGTTSAEASLVALDGALIGGEDAAMATLRRARRWQLVTRRKRCGILFLMRLEVQS